MIEQVLHSLAGNACIWLLLVCKQSVNGCWLDCIRISGLLSWHTFRYLPIFGELGELLAEISFGIKRHKPRTQDLDGRLGDDFIGIKTITPEKKTEKVSVQRKGNFNKLRAVKISEDWEFEARIIDRKEMGKGEGKIATVAWKPMKACELNKS